MTQIIERGELRLRHAIQSLRNATAESERKLELKIIDSLVAIFKDDKEGLLKALHFAGIQPKTEYNEPNVVVHSVKSKL